MKVPKPPPPPDDSGGNHDTTWTRRNVAGAAGGLAGVDYEDPRLSDPSARDPGAVLKKLAAKSSERTVAQAQDTSAEDKGRSAAAALANPELVLLDEDVNTKADKRRRRKRPTVSRDRLSVDKDAPHLLRAKKWVDDEEDEEEIDDEDPDRRRDKSVLDFDLDMLEGFMLDESRAHLFAPNEARLPGDPSLFDPDEIQAALKTPAAYAKHAMILCEAFRRATGAHRSEAIAYLARLFLGTSDRNFGRLALKEFGPSTGILDIYPLEVIEHVLVHYPECLPKVAFGRFFRNVPEAERPVLTTDTKTPLVLEYSDELKIRGFAVEGGGRPGYLFEPDESPGRYRLHIHASGRFTVLISAVNRSGGTVIDRLHIRVRPRAVADLVRSDDESTYYPPRDARRIAAWPIPSVPSTSGEEAETEEQPARAHQQLMPSGEIVRMEPLDGLTDEDEDALREAVETVLDFAEILADEGEE